MTAWEKLRYWLAGRIWPGLIEANAKVEGLEGRLKTTHKRMQEMYWDEKAKHASLGLIELLQEEIHRLDPENELLRKIRIAAGGTV